jgi:GPH family glycoside/pentoside/hexuronide:cation symporter
MPDERRVPFGSKIAFGVGQVAEGLKNTSFGLFILFYYNQVLGLPGSLCGLALGIALIFDAITDPLAGSISDNWRSRWGRRHPFMVASAIPLGLAFVGLFSPPELSEWGLFAWLLGFAVLTRAAMTLYHVPHLALGAELSSDFEERTSIVAYRMGFGYLGALITVALGFGVFFSDAAGGRLAAAGYPPYAMLVAVLMVVTIWWSAWGTRREIPFLPEPTAAPARHVLRRLGREVRSAFTNRSFRWLFTGVLLVMVMVGVETALNLYVAEFFWELSGIQISLVYLSYLVGLVAGTPFTRRLHHAFGKRAGLMFGTGGWVVCQLIPVVSRLAGEFPPNGSEALVPLLCGFRLLQGLIVQQALVSFGSMMADVADEHELESGRRQEGIFFGAVAFSGKGATGFGNLIAGVALDLIQWPTGSEVQTAADIGPETIFRLGIVYGPSMAIFAVVSVWCYSHYHLTRERHQQILVALDAARDSRAASA